MADPKDVSGTKYARQVFGRRGIDLTLADIRCLHGVVYLRGTVSIVRGASVHDLKAECELIAKILKTRPDIRDVVLDCVYRGAG